MIGVMWAAAVLVGADEKGRPTAALEGHTLRIDAISAAGGFVQAGNDGRAVKSLTITFAAEPKDAGKSYAYEIGQRFVARDAGGKEIPLGPVRSSGMREPSFRLAGYPPRKEDPFFRVHQDAMTVTLPLQGAGVTKFATLEGDLFVSEVETVEFTFAGKELDPNCVKRAGDAEAKLVMFDEMERGFNIGFKLQLPVRSKPDALVGGGGRSLAQQPCFLFATDGGRKFALRTSASSMGGDGATSNDPRQRSEREFHGVGLDRRPEALHLVILHLEPPRRLRFEIKDVGVPAAPPRNALPKKIAMGRCGGVPKL